MEYSEYRKYRDFSHFFATIGRTFDKFVTDSRKSESFASAAASAASSVLSGWLGGGRSSYDPDREFLQHFVLTNTETVDDTLVLLAACSAMAIDKDAGRSARASTYLQHLPKIARQAYLAVKLENAAKKDPSAQPAELSAPERLFQRMMRNARTGDPLGMSETEPVNMHPHWVQASKEGMAKYNRNKGLRQEVIESVVG